MPRLNRTESQERTRYQIISAAVELFLRDGFRATSLGHVATEAGFTTGAVYSNFANKTELGIAAVDAIYDRETDRAIARVADAVTESPDAWITSLSDWSASVLGDISIARLEIEINAFSAHDGTLRTANAARYARIRQHVAALLARLESEAGLRLPMDKETLAIAAVGLALGIGIQRAADPALDKDVFGRILSHTATALTPAPHSDGVLSHG
ncbi:TetR/AcrR family transcriptional regulator [Hoyosella altamirensis]|uniref:AcrR family transcriptional regulator n=1 Tax=Hoyosella altamirensis TaxID=616997 RepID=A0A839RJH6_9ACTN|nr:TetR/AcrR family transcriptional regulator [Hoyosella altamirensis]MBB3036825.1 AcrR family transcriptional regulator [Hoyosella altamirensis]